MRRWISGRAGPGKQPALECALVPGRWRWRVSFSAPNSYAMRNPVADMQEGVVDAAPGETAVVEVAVVPKPGR
jgi:hypothetical protein